MTASRIRGLAGIAGSLLITGLSQSLAMGGIQYNITDLGVEGSFADSLNSKGQAVVGNSGTNAYVFSGGILTTIPHFGYLNGNLGVNASGQIAGVSTTTGRAAVITNGTTMDLGTLGGVNSYVGGINDAGQVAGWSYPASGPGPVAFLYSKGMMTSLGTLGGASSYGNAINNKGQVVGYSDTASYPAQHAFIDTNGVMTDLGTLGGRDSDAVDINNAGSVVGFTTSVEETIGATGDIEGFLFANGVMTGFEPTGSLDFIPTSINSAGQIVGSNYFGDAYIYNNGTLTDLNSLIDPNSGWSLTSAEAIADNRDIIVEGVRDEGAVSDALLLTPVPEPITTAVLSIGALGLLLRRRPTSTKYNRPMHVTPNFLSEARNQ